MYYITKILLIWENFKKFSVVYIYEINNSIKWRFIQDSLEEYKKYIWKLGKLFRFYQTFKFPAYTYSLMLDNFSVPICYKSYFDLIWALFPGHFDRNNQRLHSTANFKNLWKLKNRMVVQYQIRTNLLNHFIKAWH